MTPRKTLNGKAISSFAIPSNVIEIALFNSLSLKIDSMMRQALFLIVFSCRFAVCLDKRLPLIVNLYIYTEFIFSKTRANACSVIFLKNKILHIYLIQ